MRGRRREGKRGQKTKGVERGKRRGEGLGRRRNVEGRSLWRKEDEGGMREYERVGNKEKDSGIWMKEAEGERGLK